MPRAPSADRVLQRLLADSPQPIVAFDRDGRVLFANDAAAAWLGEKIEELPGKRAVFGGEVSATKKLNALAPPPEVFAGTGQSRVTPALEIARRPLVFVPLLDEENSVAAVLAIVLTEPSDWQNAPPQEAASLHVRLQELVHKTAPHTALPLFGDSAVAKRLRDQVRMAAETRSRVLVLGPEGSDRESVVRAIYPSAKQSKGLLVPIACKLVDAESFQAATAGFLRRRHEAPDTRPAALLLLDVDRLRPDAQQELAGFLQLPNLELPLIATASRSLTRLAAKGMFCADLAERLTSLVIRLPRLRDRAEDIPLLAQKLLEDFAAAGGPGRSGFTTKAADELAGYEWPGELDELREVVRAACEKATRPAIDVADLPDKIRHAVDAVAHPHKPDEPIVLDEFLATIEKDVIARALARAKNNKTKAAQLLGINRGRLLRRLVQLGLAAAADEEVVFEPLPEESSD